MGPSAEDTNSQADDHDLRRHGDHSEDEYERDGWRLGYAVELNGAAVVGLGEDNQEDLVSDEEDDQRYLDYEPVPSSSDIDDDMEIVAEVRPTQAESPAPSFVTPALQAEFQQALEASSNVHLKDSDFPLEHCPEPIELDEEKIKTIKEMMSSFTLTPPSWASDLKGDDEIKQIIEKIRTKN